MCLSKTNTKGGGAGVVNEVLTLPSLLHSLSSHRCKSGTQKSPVCPQVSWGMQLFPCPAHLPSQTQAICSSFLSCLLGRARSSCQGRMQAREGMRGPCSEDSSPASHDSGYLCPFLGPLHHFPSLYTLCLCFWSPRTQTSALQAEPQEPWKPPLSLREVSGHQLLQCQLCFPSPPQNPRMLGHLLQQSKLWRGQPFFPFSCWEAEKGSKQPIWRDKGPEGRLCQPSGGARPPGRLPPTPTPTPRAPTLPRSIWGVWSCSLQRLSQAGFWKA